MSVTLDCKSTTKECKMKSKMMILFSALAVSTLPLSLQVVAQAPKPAAAIQFVTEQPPTEWLARVFLGADVQNGSGERVGDVNDLVFDRSGRISTVVIGVGGFLGMGEKSVAVPFSALTFDVAKDGGRVIIVALSKEALTLAPAFKAIEKTTMDTVKEKAVELGHKTADKAVELKDQAVKKIDDMKSAPAKQ
jgi:sporulation protein YlmC with PRC-barrel domain